MKWPAFTELVTNVQQLYNQNIRNKGLAVSSPAATTTLGMQPISFLPLAIPVAVPGGQTGMYVISLFHDKYGASIIHLGGCMYVFSK